MGLEDFRSNDKHTSDEYGPDDDRDEVLPHNKLSPSYDYEPDSVGETDEHKQFRLFCSTCDRVDSWKDDKSDVLRAIELHSGIKDHSVVLLTRTKLWD